MEEAAPERDNRSIIAHTLMCVFILLTGLGFAIEAGVGWGFVAAGFSSFIYGFILAWEPSPREVHQIVVKGEK